MVAPDVHHTAGTRTRTRAMRSSLSLVAACAWIALALACSSESESKTAGPAASPSPSSSSSTPGTSSSTAPSPTTTTTAPVSTGAGFDLVKNGNTYTAKSKDNPQIEIAIDCDDQADDGHYFSITPTIAGKRMDGPLWDTNIGLFLHDDDASYNLTDTNKCLSVEAANGRVSVKFVSGTYKNLLGSGADERPVPMNADFYLDASQHLVAELTGLYYILPTVADTTVAITTNGAVQTRAFKQPNVATLEYFENVTRIDVQDSLYGHFVIETNLQLLQLQHDLAYSRFELDYDHSFKDKGQESAVSKITFL